MASTKILLIIVAILLCFAVGFKVFSPNTSHVLTPSPSITPTPTHYIPSEPLISPHTPTVSVSVSTNVADPGEHCGGFIMNAKHCGTGYHCKLNRIADTGGVCVAD